MNKQFTLFEEPQAQENFEQSSEFSACAGYLSLADYEQMKKTLIERGYSSEIEWANNIKQPETSLYFFCEYAWVILNSGMKEQIADKIWGKICDAINRDDKVNTVFNHAGKSKAIQDAWDNRFKIFDDYLSVLIKGNDIMEWFETLPYIGKITKYHLAKNLGIDVCKPDRHLVRIAERCDTTPDELCRRLSNESGDKVACVDVVLWRMANLGLL